MLVLYKQMKSEKNAFFNKNVKHANVNDTNTGI